MKTLGGSSGPSRKPWRRQQQQEEVVDRRSKELKSSRTRVCLSVLKQSVPGQQRTTSSLQVAGKPGRTAVLGVRAADGLGGGAAAPLAVRHLTAGVFLWAVELPRAVTWYVLVLSASGIGPYHSALREGVDQPDVVLLLTCSRLHVAGVSLRTAVLSVSAADRLYQRAAAPLSCGQLAAGRP